MAEQEYCLRWNNHQSTLLKVLGKLLTSESLTDITLACDGRSMKCHKIVLSACSPYFQEILNTVSEEKHIVIYLKDVTFDELQSLVEYMYKGEVNIVQHKLPSLIKTAESLKIRGLSETDDSKKSENKLWVQPPTPPGSESPSCKKRKVEIPHNSATPPMIRVRTFEQLPPPLHPLEGKSSIDLDESRLDTKENCLQLPKSEGEFNESDLEAEGEWSDTELNASVGDDLLGTWQSNGGESGLLDLESVRLRKGRTSDGQFQCPKCGRRYQHKHTMNRHVRYICGLEPQFQCPLCEKKFHVNYRLKEHLKTNHGVESGPSPPTVNPPTTTASIALQPSSETTQIFIADISSFPSLNVAL